MPKKDYYEALGLKKGASPEEIKSAYKRLAKKFHPDISKEKEAEAKFKEIQEAYSVLSDSQKKQAYDSYGHGFEGFRGRGPGFGGFGDFSPFQDDIISEIFNMSFRSGFPDRFSSQFRRESTPERGSDIRVDLSVPFEEAAFGAEKEIKVQRTVSCEQCSGKGYKKDSDLEICEYCKGYGRIKKSRVVMGVQISKLSLCRNCHGRGKEIKNPCKKCRGRGSFEESRKIKVKVPAGINTGNFLRLAGQGNAGEHGGGSGDIYVVIFVELHEIFKRDNSDIYLEIPISFSEAALGFEIEAPTLYGMAKLKVPAGTQSGTIFRLNGKGIQHLNAGGKGDEFVKVIVSTPSRLSGKERELLEKLRGEEKLKKERKSVFKKFHEKIKKKLG